MIIFLRIGLDLDSFKDHRLECVQICSHGYLVSLEPAKIGHQVKSWMTSPDKDTVCQAVSHVLVMSQPRMEGRENLNTSGGFAAIEEEEGLLVLGRGDSS